MAAAARLGFADPGVVGEAVNLPDDRHLWPVSVVGVLSQIANNRAPSSVIIG